MRNHDVVPASLISAISGLRHGGSMKALKEVHKHKLVHRETKGYVGYRLTSLGYDYLGMRALVKRGVIESVGRSVGVGKEADVFRVAPSERLYEEVPEMADQPELAMKLHRLGRTSFRAVKAKRDYLAHRKAASWIYFSRLAAIKEYAFMCALHERGFPVPRPLGHSRHIVVMELVDGVPLNQLMAIGRPKKVAQDLLDVIERLARHGLIHCDLNEFNVIVSEDEHATVIDFPQMVSTQHPDAENLFERDVVGVVKFFEHKFEVPREELRIPKLADILAERDETDERLDTIVQASGFQTKEDDEDEIELGEQGMNNEDGAPEGINLETLELAFKREEDEAEVKEKSTLEPIGKSTESGASISNGEAQSKGTEGEPTEANVEPSAEVEEAGATPANETQEPVKLNRKAIAERVRRQRANQARRRQMARRNVVKNAERRKVKAEMESSIWQ